MIWLISHYQSWSVYVSHIMLLCTCDKVRVFVTLQCASIKLCEIIIIRGMPIVTGPSWSWSYGSWIYIYLCNQYLSPLKL